MENEQVHKKLHKKLSETIDTIADSGTLQEIPVYFGSILFDSNPKETTDPNIQNACKKILGEEVQADLPVFLKELLKQDKTELVSKLLEYYTRHQILLKNIK
jgi:hypothetical protein